MTLRHHATYANLASSLAVVIALGMGTSYAAGQLPKNSVTTKAIKKDAVIGPKIADGSVTGADMADGSLTGADLLNKSVGNDDLADSSVGTGIIRDGAVGATDLADNSVTNAKIGAGAVAGLGKLSADTLTDLRLPRADGVVSATGQLVASRSRGVTVTKIGGANEGAYCVNPTAASGIAPLTTTILTSAVSGEFRATGRRSGCPERHGDDGVPQRLPRQHLLIRQRRQRLLHLGPRVQPHDPLRTPTER